MLTVRHVNIDFNKVVVIFRTGVQGQGPGWRVISIQMLFKTAKLVKRKGMNADRKEKRQKDYVLRHCNIMRLK